MHMNFQWGPVDILLQISFKDVSSIVPALALSTLAYVGGFGLDFFYFPSVSFSCYVASAGRIPISIRVS